MKGLRAFERWLKAKRAHDKALAAKDRWPTWKAVKDPDPDALPHDEVMVPTHLLKYLKKTKAMETRSYNQAARYDEFSDLAEQHGELPF